MIRNHRHQNVAYQPPPALLRSLLTIECIPARKFRPKPASSDAMAALWPSCQCQTHSINLHVRGVSDVARTVIRSNTCMDETDEAAGRGSEAEKPPGADLPSIARGATPGHERDTARAMELRAASRLRADHLGASRTAFRLRFDRLVACPPLKLAPSRLTLGLTWSSCASHSGATKRRGELKHAPRHCALALGAGSSSLGG